MRQLQFTSKLRADSSVELDSTGQRPLTSEEPFAYNFQEKKKALLVAANVHEHLCFEINFLKVIICLLSSQN